jgi:hypothetical protein
MEDKAAMEDKNTLMPPKVSGPMPTGRQVKVRPGIAVPGSVVIVRDKEYIVSNDMTVILPADVSDEEVGWIGK